MLSDQPGFYAADLDTGGPGAGMCREGGRKVAMTGKRDESMKWSGGEAYSLHNVSF